MSLDPKDGRIFRVNLGSSGQIIHSITEWWDKNRTRWLALGADDGLILVNPTSLRSKIYSFHLEHFPQEIFTSTVVQYVLWIVRTYCG
jgi:hypothetical protein